MSKSVHRAFECGINNFTQRRLGFFLLHSGGALLSVLGSFELSVEFLSCFGLGVLDSGRFYIPFPFALSVTARRCSAYLAWVRWSTRLRLYSTGCETALVRSIGQVWAVHIHSARQSGTCFARREHFCKHIMARATDLAYHSTRNRAHSNGTLVYVCVLWFQFPSAIPADIQESLAGPTQDYRAKPNSAYFWHALRWGSLRWNTSSAWNTSLAWNTSIGIKYFTFLLHYPPFIVFISLDCLTLPNYFIF